MSVSELTGYTYVASVTALLPGAVRQQFEGISGSLTSDAGSVSSDAAAAASALVASRMGQSWQRVMSLSIDSLDIFA